MYFLPKSNKFLAWVVMVKPLHLHVITMAALVLMLSAWFFGLYVPLDTMVRQQQHQIKQSREQSLLMQAMSVSHNQLSESVKQATSAFNSYRSEGDYSSTIQNGMLYLMTQADQHAIVINTFSANAYEDKDWYARQELTLDMSGSYEKCISFLSMCAESDYVFKIRNSTITHTSGDLFHFKVDIDLIALK